MDNYQDQEDLITDIIDLTKSDHSRDFYKKAIRILGEPRVRLEYREVAGWMNEGKDIDPAKVLTSLLDGAINEQAPENQKKRSPFCPSKEILMQCFSESRPPISEEDWALKSYEISKKAYPTPTYQSHRFFTLSTNIAKSDQVTIYFPVDGGGMVPMQVLRGKRQRSKDAEELGLLDALHLRILDALNRIWVEQGCLVKGGLCFCLASVYRVAELIGWKKYGGSTLVHLTDKISHLLSRSFYILDTDREFSFLSMKTIFKPKGSKQNNFIEIYFSPEHSDFLKNKWAVTRLSDGLFIKNEIGVFLKAYIEPILISKYSKKEPTPHRIELFNLIDELNLPPAGWHYLKTERKKIFQSSANEVNKHKTASGQYFDLKILQGSNKEDCLLESRLTHIPVMIPEIRRPKTVTLGDSAKSPVYQSSKHWDAIQNLHDTLLRLWVTRTNGRWN